MDELIHRVGGSRRNIYGHFGNKQGLFVETVQSLCAEVTRPLLEAPMADTDIRTGLTRYGHHALEVLLQPRTLAMHRLMINEGQRFPELARALLHSGCKAAACALGGWMAGRQARGDLRLDHAPADLAAQFFNLLVSGPQVMALVGEMPDDWHPEGITRHVRNTVELFLHGAAAPLAGRSPPD